MGRISAVLLTLALAGGSAHAAPDPKFDKPKAEEAKGKIVWKASVNTGLVLNTGNANNLAFTAGAFASMMAGRNKLQLDVGGTYARATTLSAVDTDMNGAIARSEVVRTRSTTAALWALKLRYDRFLTSHDALYIAGVATGNKPAGVNVAGGAQAGYSRTLFKNDMHLAVAEVGYDFTYQDNVTGVDLSIHSLRLFAGYTVTFNANVGMTFGIETLSNLNTLEGYVAGTEVKAFRHTRINGNAALNAKIWKNLAFQASFLARYNTNPSLLAPFALPYEAGFVPRAERLDTVTSLSLVVTLL
jgi:hypothetical protein